MDFICNNFIRNLIWTVIFTLFAVKELCGFRKNLVAGEVFFLILVLNFYGGRAEMVLLNFPKM